MKSGSTSLNGYVNSPVQPDWSRQFERWRDLIAECGHKPSRKRVHGLRVATLRLQAEIDFRLLDHDAHDPLVDAARCWKKQADKVRKALSPVRDADVYLDMLKKLRTEGAAQDQSPLSSGCMREIEKLEGRLREKHNSAEKELLVEIRRRLAKLETSSRNLQNNLDKRNAWAGSDRARMIRGLIAGLAAEIPALNAETLHDFRKRAKTARYLSEIPAKKNLQAARQTALLKKMQNAVGKWHDWQTLAAHAQHALGTAEGDGLVRLLEERAEESLQSALDQCRQMTAQLLDQSVRTGTSVEIRAPKKPVRRAEVPTEARAKHYA
jgi:CHAD domain-containing protein